MWECFKFFNFVYGFLLISMILCFLQEVDESRKCGEVLGRMEKEIM